jgi:hypothetical protein
MGAGNLTAITTVTGGDGAEKLIVTGVDGNNGDSYRAVVCQATLAPTATSSFLSLSGTASSWTVLPTLQQNTSTGSSWAPYGFNASTQPYGSAANLFTAVGPSGLNDQVDYGCPVVGQRLVANGATWTVDGSIETLSADSFESMLGSSTRYAGDAYFFSSNRATDSGTGNLFVSKIASDGTFTASVAGTLNYGVYSGEPALFGNVTSGGSILLAEIPLDFATVGSNTRARIHWYLNGRWSSADFRSSAYDGAIAWGTAGSSGFADGLIVVSSDWSANNEAQLATATWIR